MPLTIGVLLLLAFALVPGPSSTSGFIGLGRKRIALGALGAISGVLLLCLYHAALFNFEGGSATQLLEAQFWTQYFASLVYLFVFSVPFVVAYVAIIGIPLIAFLQRLRKFSIVTFVMVGLLFSMGIGLWLAFSGAGSWCAQNRLNCFVEGAMGAGIPIVVIHFGFALFSRTPLSSASPSEN